MLAEYRDLATIEATLPDLPRVGLGPAGQGVEFPVKFWLHRVDSVERAELMAGEYRGLELDVVYDSAGGYFDVGHPPVPSVGLSLEQLIGSIPDPTNHYFWIDFKNLTEANEVPSCALLESIARKYGLMRHMIVESTNPRALSCFGERGFYTSYYLFPDATLESMSPAQVRVYYEEVKANLQASRVNALSSNYRSLPFIRKYFPGMDVLLWYLEPARNLRFYATRAYLAHQGRVRVILVNQRSRGYR
jgi:heptose-I-phosphate ethanolaminephosphotransferase